MPRTGNLGAGLFYIRSICMKKLTALTALTALAALTGCTSPGFTGKQMLGSYYQGAMDRDLQLIHCGEVERAVNKGTEPSAYSAQICDATQYNFDEITSTAKDGRESRARYLADELTKDSLEKIKKSKLTRHQNK